LASSRIGGRRAQVAGGELLVEPVHVLVVQAVLTIIRVETLLWSEVIALDEPEAEPRFVLEGDLPDSRVAGVDLLPDRDSLGSKGILSETILGLALARNLFPSGDVGAPEEDSSYRGGWWSPFSW
jgi:hypothetical protein